MLCLFDFVWFSICFGWSRFYFGWFWSSPLASQLSLQLKREDECGQL